MKWLKPKREKRELLSQAQWRLSSQGRSFARAWRAGSREVDRKVDAASYVRASIEIAQSLHKDGVAVEEIRKKAVESLGQAFESESARIVAGFITRPYALEANPADVWLTIVKAIGIWDGPQEPGP